MNTHKTAIVIGGGLAGLACAVELANRGLYVTIVERNAHLGGKMNVLTASPTSGPLSGSSFTFDMGPTIITMPEVLLGIFARCNRVPSDYINLVNLDPQWRCLFEDGTRIDLARDASTMAASLDLLFPASKPGAGFEKFLAFSRRMYSLSEKVFFYKDVGSAIDMMRSSPMNDPRLVKDVIGMRMHSTMGATAHSMIKEPHVRQMVEHFLQYVGSSPFLAPAILSLIPSAQLDHGCWYPMGGTRNVARSLERLARELGVHFRTSTSVDRILLENKRAIGVQVSPSNQRGSSPETLRADIVVSNCDVQRTLRDLIPAPVASPRAAKIAHHYKPACSGVVLYLGLSRQYEHPAHHDFLFSHDSDREFNDIYIRGIPTEDPTLYLAVPSRTDSSQAPPGCESLYILVHTPYLRPGHDWLLPDGSPGPTLNRYRTVILEKLKRFGMPDIESHIQVERFLTPTNIDKMYNAEGGAIYGLASHGRLMGGFKPRNRSLVLDNLYLVGGSVNPGPGVPMVLMSGVTGANAALEDLGIDPESPIPAKPLPRVETKPWTREHAMAN